MQTILGDLLALYRARLSNTPAELPPARPFRDYIDWIGTQDPAQVEAYWRAHLKGFRNPTAIGGLLAVGALFDPENDDPYGEVEQCVDANATAALVALGRRFGVTLGTIVQGAWAVLLARYSGDDDIVFGATVSGRSAPIADVERIVGPLINTLPVRALIKGSSRVVDWLVELQRSLIEARRFEATPLSLVNRWSDVARGRPLFETLVVFENYPLDATLTETAGTLGFSGVRVRERTEYPLTLMAFPGPELGLRLTFDKRRLDALTVERMLGHFIFLLENLAAQPLQALDALPIAPADEMRRLLDQWNEVQMEPRLSIRRSGPNGTSAVALDRELDQLSDEDVDALIGDLLDVEEAPHES